MICLFVSSFILSSPTYRFFMEFTTKFWLKFLKSEVVYISVAPYQKASYYHSYPGRLAFTSWLQTLGSQSLGGTGGENLGQLKSTTKFWLKFLKWWNLNEIIHIWTIVTLEGWQSNQTADPRVPAPPLFLLSLLFLEHQVLFRAVFLCVISDVWVHYPEWG